MSNDRKYKLLGDLDLANACGVEVGALCRPIVEKSETRVLYVDWADAETSRRKYANDPYVDVTKIVEVDGIWGECSLKDCLGGRNDFDYVVASHVIEHVPDLVGWMNEVAQILRPGGRLALAVPDRRFTFDYRRKSSTLGEVIGAYVQKSRRPTPGQVFDFSSRAANGVDVARAWEGRMEPSTLKSFKSKRDALQESFQSIEEGVYIDVHCWVVTPSSFLGILADLVDMDLLPFRCASFFTTEPYFSEFFIRLERLSTGTPSDETRNAARKTFLDAQARLGEIENLESELSPVDSTAKIEALTSELRDIKGSRAWRVLSQLRSARRTTVSVARAFRSRRRQLVHRVFGR